MSYENPPLQEKARERLEALSKASENVVEALAIWCAIKGYRDEVQFLSHASHALDKPLGRLLGVVGVDAFLTDVQGDEDDEEAMDYLRWVIPCGL